MTDKKEKEKKEKQQRFRNALMTGAALGLQLKAAHSRIGEKTLSDVFDGAGSATKALKKEFEEENLLDINATKLKEMAEITKKAFKEGVADNTLKVDTHSNESLVEYISESLDIINSTDKKYGGKFNDFIIKQFNTDKIINPTIEKFIDSNEVIKEDEALRHKFTDFVQMAAKNIDNDLKIKGAYEDTIGNYNDELGSDFMDKVIETLSEYKSHEDTLFDDYKKEFEGIQNQIIEKTKDIDELKKNFGSDNKKANFLDKVLEDHAATVKDVLENEDIKIDNEIIITKEDSQGIRKKQTVSVKETLEEFRGVLSDDQKEAFDDLYIDYKSLRKTNSGNIYSRYTQLNAKERALKGLSETSIGTLLKTNDILSVKESPNILFTSRQTDDFILSLYNKADVKNTTDSGFVKILNKTYKITKDDIEDNLKYELKHIEELDDALLVDKSSTAYKLLNKMSGNVTERTKYSNKYLNWLDIGQSGRENIFERRRTKATEEYARYTGKGAKDELIKNMSTILSKEDYTDQEIEDVIKNYKNVNQFFVQNSGPINKTTAKKLAQNTKSKGAKNFFRYATMDEDELLKTFADKEISSLTSKDNYYNYDLKSLMSRYIKDPTVAKNYKYVKKTKSGKVTYSFEDLLRREIIKEGFIREAEDSIKEQNKIELNTLTTLIKKSGIKGDELKKTNMLMSWSIMQYTTAGFNNYSAIKNKGQAKELIDHSRDLITLSTTEKNKDFAKTVRKTVSNLLNTKEDVVYKDIRKDKDLIKHFNNNQWAYVKKAVNPLDYLRNINDGTKRKAFYKQFVAGSDKFEKNITAATLFPYFFTNRVNENLSKVGLDLSSQSSTSAWKQYGNLMLKRALPAYVGMTYLSHLNDVSKGITGTSVAGAFANSLAATDLGARKFLDATHIGKWYDSEKKVNPLLSYWTNSENYQDYKERKEWYQDGYSPVRKGRFWSFGSLNEFRGGKISYYQPNYLRRVHSDWEDELLYKSKSQKWRHSPLPTITHPLSPVAFLANPYWLEQQHKEDMPYPVSGPLFEENTPWGTILNPTVGRLIKPTRKMHQKRLGKNMVDAKSLIEIQNEKIRQKAKDKNNENVFVVDDSNIVPNDYVSTYAPTISERVLTTTNKSSYPSHADDSSNGNSQAQTQQTEYSDTQGIQYYPIDRYPEAVDIKDYIKNFDNYSIAPTKSEKASNKFKQFFTQQDKQSNSSGFNDIENINNQTKEKAVNNPNINANSPYTLTAESIQNMPAKYGNTLLESKTIKKDLKEVSSNKQYIEDLLYSSSKMAGIYGYAARSVFNNNISYRLSNAGEMTSFSKKFWDQSLGGLGGSSAQTFRRFIPSSNKNIKHVNPLLNTMPDWLPDRFRYGNPYKSIPKGGMRLPGKGYESLNKLHSDRFGKYGAFDRYKILADTAPYSREYKIWKDIAQKTVTDPALQKEIKGINTRAADQSKSHDFYPYKFKGKKVDNRNAIIEEVYGNNYFKVLNDNNIYRMAGLHIDTQDSVLQKYIKPGMGVRLITDQNDLTGTNNDKYNSISAAIIAGDTNVNKTLLDNKEAKEREDKSSAATIGTYSPSKVARGKLFETIAHVDIPIIHDKIMRIETPMESYKRHQIYGNEQQSWSHPIKTFLRPAMDKSIASGKRVALGTAVWATNVVARHHGVCDNIQRALNITTLAVNRGSLTGAFATSLLNFGTKNLLKGELEGATRVGANIGALGALAGYTFTRRDKPIQNTINMGLLGATAFGQFYDSKKLQSIAKPIINNFTKENMTLAGAVVGGTVGLMYAGGKTSFLQKDRKNAYIPKRTKEKWELEEYFDRLEYIKYTGLYNKAMKKAYTKEGVNVNRLLRLEKRSAEEKDKIRTHFEKQKEAISKSNLHPQEKMNRLKDIENMLKTLDTQFAIKGGKWTRMALLYKEAANSTIYGLQKNATWSQILRALPKNERDYFLELAKEKDPKEQKKILKYTSPYQQKALQVAWGKKPKKPKSNAAYFSKYKMPSFGWSGWRPNIDLADIKVKTIENEGMILSDFGEYESCMAEPGVQNANPIDYDESTNAFMMQKNLALALKGAGLTGVNIKVYPNNSGKIESFVNINKINKYKLQDKVNKTLNKMF